ncbi:MAG TPA: class I SAM-dependent methyltransferase [Thermoanaerobaculia bacterium]|nr:class I SAM-dependent methyltransferase [Thermoanaerobaculia bacterium]
MDPHTHEWGTQPQMFGPLHAHRLARIVHEVTRLPRGSRILDGAVGLGTLATRLQQSGYAVTGIDYSFDAALHVKKTTSIPAIVGDMTKMPFRDGAFDGLTSGETLEHLEADDAAAAEIRRVLRKDGVCVTTVPALMSLWSSSDVYYEHRRRYSREQLRSLFQSAGLKVAKASYWGFPIALIYDFVFLRPMNRRRAKHDVNRDAMLGSIQRAGRSKLLVAFVRALFAIDRLFSWLPYGPGLLLVARKQ